MSESLVYYLRRNDLIKIGWSGNLKARMRALRPDELLAAAIRVVAGRVDEVDAIHERVLHRLVVCRGLVVHAVTDVSLDVKKGGVIIRTAAEGASAEDIERDLVFLQRLWKTIETRAKSVKAPALVYQEAELPLRIVRDLFAEGALSTAFVTTFSRRIATDGDTRRWSIRIPKFLWNMPAR